MHKKEARNPYKARMTFGQNLTTTVGQNLTTKMGEIGPELGLTAHNNNNFALVRVLLTPDNWPVNWIKKFPSCVLPKAREIL